MAQAQEQELALHSLETQHTARLEKALEEKAEALKRSRLEREDIITIYGRITLDSTPFRSRLEREAEIEELQAQHAVQVAELQEYARQAQEIHAMQARLTQPPLQRTVNPNPVTARLTPTPPDSRGVGHYVRI